MDLPAEVTGLALVLGAGAIIFVLVVRWCFPKPEGFSILVALSTSRKRAHYSSKKYYEAYKASRVNVAKYLAQGDDHLAERTAHNAVEALHSSDRFSLLGKRLDGILAYLRKVVSPAKYASYVAAIVAAERSPEIAMEQIAELEAALCRDAAAPSFPPQRSVPSDSCESIADEVQALLRDIRDEQALDGVSSRLYAVKANRPTKR